MKEKLFCSLTFLLLSTPSLFSQATITFRVDVSQYVASGSVIAPDGIKIAGTFGANNGMNDVTPMLDWAPDDAASTMTDIGNGWWEITVMFTNLSLGDTLLYKFVNGTWYPTGDNEGRDFGMVNAGCAFDDGWLGSNRYYFFNTLNDTLSYCWDSCWACYPPPPDSLPVTFRVDISNYLEEGDSIFAEGMKIAGTFQSNGATANGLPMKEWSDTDQSGNMIDIGNGLWEITVKFPETAEGDTLFYEYVNGSFGSPPFGDNEGSSPNSQIGPQGCGTGIPGNYDRVYVIGTADTATNCWDACDTCQLLTGIVARAPQDLSQLRLYPNPMSKWTAIQFMLSYPSDDITISIYNAFGIEVATILYAHMEAGANSIIWNGLSRLGTALTNGRYQCVVKTEQSAINRPLIILR